ncbi:MAG: hypothetical protein F9K30_24245 [Dechloromonas sp.]|nr:MAG: hypothetical protein F9K30_24245 [Dechloromonas sp.]
MTDALKPDAGEEAAEGVVAKKKPESGRGYMQRASTILKAWRDGAVKSEEEGSKKDILLMLHNAMVMEKARIRYTDVARIRLLLACRASESSAVQLAELLLISKQTRRQWFGDGMVAWLEMAVQRYLGPDYHEGGDCPVWVREKSLITPKDIEWIEVEYLQEPVGQRQVRAVASKLRNKAKGAGREHLANISYVTVWYYTRHLKQFVKTNDNEIPERTEGRRKWIPDPLREKKPAAKSLPALNVDAEKKVAVRKPRPKRPPAKDVSTSRPDVPVPEVVKDDGEAF